MSYNQIHIIMIDSYIQIVLWHDRDCEWLFSEFHEWQKLLTEPEWIWQILTARTWLPEPVYQSLTTEQNVMKLVHKLYNLTWTHLFLYYIPIQYITLCGVCVIIAFLSNFIWHMDYIIVCFVYYVFMVSNFIM